MATVIKMMLEEPGESVSGEIETKEYSDNILLYGQSSLLVFLFIAGLVTNGPVLLLYFRSKHIRSITDKFLLNLLLADVFSVVLLFPCILYTFIQNSIVLNELSQNSQNVTLEEEMRVSSSSWSCSVSNGIISGVGVASVLAALEIAIERYLAVVKPLHYHKFLTTTSILTTSLISGVISLATAIIASFEPHGNFSIFPHCQDYDQSQLFSENEKNDHRLWIWSLYSLTSLSLLFILPVLIMIYIYAKIWLEARRQKIKISSQYKPYFLPVSVSTTSSMPESGDIIAKDSQGEEVGGKKGKGVLKGAAFLPIIVKFRLMNRLRAGRLDRAGRVAVMALFVTILCWSPYYWVKGWKGIQILWTMYNQNNNISSESQTSTSTLTSYSIPLLLVALHPLLSPLFYAYRYKRMRTELGKWISWEGQNNNNSSYYCSSSGNVHDKCIRQTIITPQEQAQTVVVVPDQKTSQSHQDIKIDMENSDQIMNQVPTIIFSSDDDDNDHDGDAHDHGHQEDSSNSNSNSNSSNNFVGGSIVRVGNFFNYLNIWVNSYSRRWLVHRESVTSTASFITLLSSKYHNNSSSSSSKGKTNSSGCGSVANV